MFSNLFSWPFKLEPFTVVVPVVIYLDDETKPWDEHLSDAHDRRDYHLRSGNEVEEYLAIAGDDWLSLALMNRLLTGTRYEQYIWEFRLIIQELDNNHIKIPDHLAFKTALIIHKNIEAFVKGSIGMKPTKKHKLCYHHNMIFQGVKILVMTLDKWTLDNMADSQGTLERMSFLLHMFKKNFRVVYY
jgi:hypothetical protein